MKAVAVFVALAALTAPSIVAAQDTFLGTYARSEAACKATEVSENIEDSIVVEASGLSGYELGCQFVDMHGVTYDGVTDQFVAIAQCSDDSGIFRPDNFSLVFNNERRELVLQSQNEYVAGENYLSGDFVRCD